MVVLLTVYTLDESMTSKEREALRAMATKLSLRAALAVRPLMLAMTIGFVTQFALGLIIATFALFGEEVLFDSNPELGVGLLLGFVGLSQLFTQTALLPSALKHFGEERTLVVGVVIRSFGLLFFALTVSPILAAAGGMFFSMGGGLALPPTQSIATKAVDDSMRGGVLGVFQSVQSFAFIVSTAIGGVLFSVYPHLPNQVAFAASILSIVPAVALGRYLRLHARKGETWVP